MSIFKGRYAEELQVLCLRYVIHYEYDISHPITGFKDDSAYVTTKTAGCNKRITEDG